MAIPGPALLIFGPLLGGLVTLLLSRWQRLAALVGTALTWLLMAMLAAVPLAPTEVEVANRLFAGDTLQFYGRAFVLTDGIRSLALFMYGGLSLLMLLSVFFSQGRNFVPGCMAALSPLIGMVMVEPASFSALLLIVAMVLIVPVIQAEQAGSTRAAYRYLTMGVLAVPLLLIAGWMSSGERGALILPASRLLLVGAIILLAGFPFHIWVNPIAARSAPLVAVYLFGLVQLAVMFFLSQALSATAALKQDPVLLRSLQQISAITVGLSGVLAAAATDRGRLLGSLLLMDMAMTSLAMATGDPEGWRTAVALQTARFVSLILVATGNSMLRSAGPDSLPAGRDEIGRRAPFGMALFVYGCLSLLGLPLTSGFAGRWDLIVSTGKLPEMGWLPYVLLLAMIGGTFSLLRILASLAGAADGDVETSADAIERPWFRVMSALMLLAAVWIAIFPQAFRAYAQQLADLLR